MFKDNLKKYRLKANYDQNKLSIKLNVSIGLIEKWETGKCLPSSDKLDLICCVLDVSEKDLLDEYESKKINRRLKIKNMISKSFMGLLFAFVILLTLSFIITIIDKNTPKYSKTNVFSGYVTEQIGLEVGEKYKIDFDTILKDVDVEYDKVYIEDSEYYSVIGNTIKVKKEGYFYVGFVLKNKKEKLLYEGNFLRVFSYDINNMIQINTVDDLINMNNYKSGHYILNSDLDLKDIANFEPIGNSPDGNQFTGMFINPNNYVIKNLTISSANEIYNGPYGDCNGGLFGSIKNAYIDNILLENINIDVSDFTGDGLSDAGGLAAYVFNSLVTNCKVSGTVKAQFYAGGLAGLSDYSTLYNNSFTGVVVQQNSQNKKIVAAGGLVGRIYGCESKDSGVSCYIRNNNVTADVYSEQVAGALCGFKFGDCIYDNTVNCNLNAPLTFIDGKNIYDFS